MRRPGDALQEPLTRRSVWCWRLCQACAHGCTKRSESSLLLQARVLTEAKGQLASCEKAQT